MDERIIIPADPDSQFRLVPCSGCGCIDAHYEQGKSRTGLNKYRVVCPECGEYTAWYWTQHGAQLDWNGDAA